MKMITVPDRKRRHSLQWEWMSQSSHTLEETGSEWRAFTFNFEAPKLCYSTWRGDHSAYQLGTIPRMGGWNAAIKSSKLVTLILHTASRFRATFGIHGGCITTANKEWNQPEYVHLEQFENQVKDELILRLEETSKPRALEYINTFLHLIGHNLSTAVNLSHFGFFPTFSYKYCCPTIQFPFLRPLVKKHLRSFASDLIKSTQRQLHTCFNQWVQFQELWLFFQVMVSPSMRPFVYQKIMCIFLSNCLYLSLSQQLSPDSVVHLEG